MQVMFIKNTRYKTDKKWVPGNIDLDLVPLVVVCYFSSALARPLSFSFTSFRLFNFLKQSGRRPPGT